jgi:hypothetical protein
VEDLEADVSDGRLGQGSAQVARGHASRAAGERRSPGGKKHCDGVLVAGGAGGKQVHRDRRGTRASRSKDPSGPAVKFSPNRLGHLFSDRRPAIGCTNRIGSPRWNTAASAKSAASERASSAVTPASGAASPILASVPRVATARANPGAAGPSRPTRINNDAAMR